MDHFKWVIKMELLWLAVAILFHVVSFIRISMGGVSLSESPPILAISVLCVFFPILYLGWKSHLVSYGVINGLAIGLVFYTGYLFRITMYLSPEGISAYPSAVGWYVGFLINTFGIPVGFYGSYLALRLAWKKKSTHPVG
jgi:hypothetical protein